MKSITRTLIKSEPTNGQTEKIVEHSSTSEEVEILRGPTKDHSSVIKTTEYRGSKTRIRKFTIFRTLLSGDHNGAESKQLSNRRYRGLEFSK